MKAARWALFIDAMEGQAQEQELLRGIGPFRHAATIEETTQKAEGGETQTETGA